MAQPIMSKRIFVYWICDKRNCHQENHRQIGAGEIVIEDDCYYCGAYIREPITYTIEIDPGKDKKKPKQ